MTQKIEGYDSRTIVVLVLLALYKKESIIFELDLSKHVSLTMTEGKGGKKALFFNSNSHSASIILEPHFEIYAFHFRQTVKHFGKLACFVHFSNLMRRWRQTSYGVYWIILNKNGKIIDLFGINWCCLWKNGLESWK